MTTTDDALTAAYPDAREYCPPWCATLYLHAADERDRECGWEHYSGPATVAGSQCIGGGPDVDVEVYALEWQPQGEPVSDYGHHRPRRVELRLGAERVQLEESQVEQLVAALRWQLATVRVGTL